MAEEGHMLLAETGPRKRKSNRKKGSKAKKKLKVLPGPGTNVKINQKMKKLFRKRANEYNSDDEEEEEELAHEPGDDISLPAKEVEGSETGDSSDAKEEDRDVDSEKEDFSNDEENGEIQPGIANFAEGLRAFKMAFKSVLKNSVADDALGPVLSANKKLVAEKLAEEEAERKVKGEAKKERHLAEGKGHVKPANYLDSHEKFLIGVATKGVVKLFNAVNKAQHAQKGLNPSRSKDAKVIKKRSKETFFSELGKTLVLATDGSKDLPSSGVVDGEGPAWAPLRDNYMLTNSKLKDWDRMLQESTVADDVGRMLEDDDSGDDE